MWFSFSISKNIFPFYNVLASWKLLLLLHLLSQGECYIRRGKDSPMDISSKTFRRAARPKFAISHSGNVIALASQVAILNCRVHNIGNRTVSWIRHRDIHLLTVGKYTYTSDQRFRAHHVDESDDWVLKITYAQIRDSGIYECQVSTTPPISHFVTLKVVEPVTRILGGPDIHINKGSTINLTCVVAFSPFPPQYITWHHNDGIISYDSDRGGITIIIEKGDITTSSLLIQNAAPNDSGRYGCQPSNTAASNITAHILNGEKPKAMQHAGQSTVAFTLFVFLPLFQYLFTNFTNTFL